MKIFIKCLYSKSSITELLWLLLVGLILPLALAVRPHESKETIIAAQVEHCPAPGSVFSPCQVLKPHNHPRVWQCPFHQWGNWGTNWFATSLGSGNDRNEHGHSAFESIPLSTRWLLHYAEEETEARRSCGPEKWGEEGTPAVLESQSVWLVALKSGPGSCEAQASLFSSEITHRGPHVSPPHLSKVFCLVLTKTTGILMCSSHPHENPVY